ncbi:uncharacterized protein Z519_10802 [Cladophialophora bantiana CBS 173.52]|uniref:Uncharacterized protein n=1 Tax=Cladophialophora bantiana (strain ATCC 10958 / CBS 173.52 / CDC B-1940 / NIH 8579) TaxID=1442370 RepID=A0A0D2HCY6_CLAB1|nr:uncharacterized protein Z519_10802 [Cladophialophora bantiana CBS 173.52]KIW88755.1 hypothetical protein Z519_10802 [Cladophialophora bantiana CBS 173.52]
MVVSVAVDIGAVEVLVSISSNSVKQPYETGIEEPTVASDKLIVVVTVDVTVEAVNAASGVPVTTGIVVSVLVFVTVEVTVLVEETAAPLYLDE